MHLYKLLLLNNRILCSGVRIERSKTRAGLGHTTYGLLLSMLEMALRLGDTTFDESVVKGLKK